MLRNKRTKDVYLVVVFSLFLKEDLNEDGTLRVPETEAKEKAANVKPQDEPEGDEGVDSEHEIVKRSSETGVDDVD